MRRCLLLAALALAACNTGFAPQYRVEDVRILAIASVDTSSSTNPLAADVLPGDALRLQALVANPLARPGLSVSWYACLPPASDALVPCEDGAYLADPSKLAAAVGTVPGVLSLGTGTIDPAGVATLTNIATVTLDPVPDVSTALAFAIYQATQNSTYACALYAQLVVVAVASAEGQVSTALKSVRILPSQAELSASPVTVSDQYTPNDNPTVYGVYRNPTDAQSCSGGVLIDPGLPAGRVTICGTVVTGSSEPYNVCNPGGGTTVVDEIMEWQWYVTAGNFPKVGGVGNATGENIDFEPPAGPFTLWTVLRDERGGIAWKTYGF